MSFQTTPIVTGDTYEMAHRFAREVEQELAGIADPAAQAAILEQRWAQLTALGWTATAIPEEAGGAGGDLAELAALAGGAGRAGLALPIASACGVVPALLAGQAAQPAYTRATAAEQQPEQQHCGRQETGSKRGRQLDRGPEDRRRPELPRKSGGSRTAEKRPWQPRSRQKPRPP
jgi:alkylation response protein AidB-like acyl-CoA dehydrogenase